MNQPTKRIEKKIGKLSDHKELSAEVKSGIKADVATRKSLNGLAKKIQTLQNQYSKIADRHNAANEKHWNRIEKMIKACPKLSKKWDSEKFEISFDTKKGTIIAREKAKRVSPAEMIAKMFGVSPSDIKFNVEPKQAPQPEPAKTELTPAATH